MQGVHMGLGYSGVAWEILVGLAGEFSSVK
jgi:hypothetical protein